MTCECGHNISDHEWNTTSEPEPCDICYCNDYKEEPDKCPNCNQGFPIYVYMGEPYHWYCENCKHHWYLDRYRG